MEKQKLSKSWPPLTDYPNAPDNLKKNPSSVTKKPEIQTFLEYFNASRFRNHEHNGLSRDEIDMLRSCKQFS